MLNNRFIKSTFILMISGLITKILGFIIKILYTRTIGPEGISLYTLIVPSYSLFITIATLALPISISKLVAENKYKSSQIISTSLIIILALDTLLILFTILLKDYISITLLKEPRISTFFVSMAITFPFISISNVLKGYFFGKQKMIPNSISNIAEQILRIILIVIFLPILLEKSIVYAVSGLILLNVFSESISIIIFILFLPRIKSINIKPQKKICKDILKVSIPTVSSRFVGNIGFFFEPIILTNLLLYKGLSRTFIISEYGVYNAYAISTLTLPSFFIMAISSALIPEISRYYANGNLYKVKKRVWQAIYISFFIGSSFSMAILVFREPLLNILYKTNIGADYIKILAPFFVLFYLEGPLISSLQALNKAHITLKITTAGIILKLSFILIFALLNQGICSLIYAEIINIFFVVILAFYHLNKTLFKNQFF